MQDLNDHCPTLTSTYQSICSDSTVVTVTAFDEDDHPNGEPYKFVLKEEETHGKWEMLPVNGKADNSYSTMFMFLFILVTESKIVHSNNQIIDMNNIFFKVFFF